MTPIYITVNNSSMVQKVNSSETVKLQPFLYSFTGAIYNQRQQWMAPGTYQYGSKFVTVVGYEN